MKQIANILTGYRILGSILLLFFPTFSLGFYVTYLLCGLSDMVDGTIARRTNSVSRFGSQLDTVADMVFVIASLIKVLPAIDVQLTSEPADTVRSSGDGPIDHIAEAA